MTGLTMADGRESPNGDGGITAVEAQRRRRGRNLIILAALVAFVALIYGITVIKLAGA